MLSYAAPSMAVITQQQAAGAYHDSEITLQVDGDVALLGPGTRARILAQALKEEHGERTACIWRQKGKGQVCVSSNWATVGKMIVGKGNLCQLRWHVDGQTNSALEGEVNGNLFWEESERSHRVRSCQSTESLLMDPSSDKSGFGGCDSRILRLSSAKLRTPLVAAGVQQHQ